MFDLVLQNGLIMDGSGSPAFYGSVGISGDRIACISRTALQGKLEVDAGGRVIAPGFIDMHTHSDYAPWNAPGFESRLHQGFTTDIGGNCGDSAVPKTAQKDPRVRSLRMKEMLAELKTIPLGANFGTFIGHGTLRRFCMDNPYAPVPTAHELEKMERILREEIRAGALGLSVGLEYMPGMCCETDELIALAGVVNEFDGIVTVHMRNEDESVWEAIEEVRRIARESGAHLHISHFKVCEKKQWGQAGAALAAFDAARRESRITADSYPYTAFSNGLRFLLPAWAKKGSYDEITARFADDTIWEQFCGCVSAQIEKNGGPAGILLADTYGVCTDWEGKSLQEMAALFGCDAAAAFRRIMLTCRSRVSGIYHAASRSDVLRFLAREDLALISDSANQDFVTGARKGRPHPRATSSAAAFLRLVREEKLMSAEKAVAKLTSVPAAILGLRERGLLKEGFFADIVIFSPETAAERGSYTDPFRTAVGFDRVYVSGALAWAEGKPAARAGKVIAK